jgi:hypothetical protein
MDDLVVCQNSADRLRGPLFVVVENRTQPFMARNSKFGRLFFGTLRGLT